ARQSVDIVSQLVDAMEVQASFAAPHDNVTVLQTHFARPSGAGVATPEKSCGHTERYRHDRFVEVPFVAILVQCESGTRFIPIDQASVWLEVFEACCVGGAHGKVDKDPGQRWPRSLRLRIHRTVPISASVADPAGFSAVG